MGTEEYLLQKAEKKGIEKGIEKGRDAERITFAKTLLANTEFDDDKIAMLASVEPAVVKQLRKDAATGSK